MEIIIEPDKAPTRSDLGSITTPEFRLAWRVRRLDHKPAASLVIGFAALAAGAAGLFFFHTPLMGVLGFAMILASTADYWLGAKFLVDSKSAQARVGVSQTAMEWKDVKRVIVEPGAVKLSPLSQAGSLDAFRGVTLRTTPDCREPLLAAVAAFAPQSAVILSLDKDSEH